jgi:cytochrome c-type biogenesis protein CcmH
LRHRGTATAFVLLLWCIWAAPVLAQVTDEQVETTSRQIAQELKCPVCQELSVADSPSQLAGQMRGIIREKVAAGESREAIIRFFEDRYGESIQLTPPRTGFSVLVWIAPYLALLAALGFLIVMVRRSARDPAPAPDWTDPLDPYLAEVDRTFERVKDEPLR